MSKESNSSSDEVENDVGFGDESIEMDGMVVNDLRGKPLKRRKSSPVSDLSTITVSSTDSGHASYDDKLNFKLQSYVKEKRTHKLYSIEFNHYLKQGQPNIFAVCGGTRCSIYECTSKGNIKLLMCFEDPDKKEDFYTCCWTVSQSTKRSVIVTAGTRGVIRIFQPENETMANARHLIGHGHEVNQVKISPKKPFLLASASRDRSIRLWNIDTSACIAIFLGDDAHRSDVVTVDFNCDCSKLVSGGVDHILAIWDLTVPEIVETIEKSQKYNETTSNRAIKTVLQSFPIFHTRNLHSNYIDCVEWLNDFILSKSNENDFFCWKPGAMPSDGETGKKAKNTPTVVANFEVERCTFYFMRFATSFDRTLLALGGDVGNVRIWDLKATNPFDIPFVDLTHKNRKQIVRDLSFSRCGRALVFCCEDGTIWYYQRTN